MTLSTWFRDYLYIPLGGSRGSGVRTYLNLGIVFLVTGLWHGANWTFVVWGAYHGALLMIERLTGARGRADGPTHWLPCRLRACCRGSGDRRREPGQGRLHRRRPSSGRDRAEDGAR